MLLWRTWLPHEQLVAARPVARTIWEIFRNFGCALALARGIGNLGCRSGAPGFPLPLSIPTALRLTTFFALRTRSIRPRCTPPPPATRRLPAPGTTVAGLGKFRLKPVLASL